MDLLVHEASAVVYPFRLPVLLLSCVFLFAVLLSHVSLNILGAQASGCAGIAGKGYQ